MCDRPKIHVFLGAPPPLVHEAKEETQDWKQLELTWRDGQLRPAGEKPGSQVSSCMEDAGTDHSGTRQDDPTHTDGTTDTLGQEGPAGRFSSNKDGSSDSDQCSTSVHQYLDCCFPAAQPGPEPEPGPDLQPSAVAPALSSQTHYLTTWTLSQSLILRARRSSQSAASPSKNTHTPPSGSSSTPELFSSLTPSPAASAELFSHSFPKPLAEEGGIVLKATADGVLCSQESTAHDSPLSSPINSPSSKRARVSEESAAPKSSTSTKPQSLTTPLSLCIKPGERHSVLVAVVHPCHLKEVKVKSGPSAGTFVPLASIVVTDQSDVEMKVVLWRRAAFWVLTVNPGDVLLITGLQVEQDRWRGETVLQSTFNSKLLNLGQISTSTSLPVTQQVDARSLSSLCGFLRERRPLLVSLPHRPPQDLSRLPYILLRSLKVNTLVHALLRVTHTLISSEWRSEAESRSRSAVLQKAALTVEQPGGQQGVLQLWGAAVDWLPNFNKNRGAVWDFRVLLVRDSLTSDLPELHSTPWSSVRAVDPSDCRLQDFQLMVRPLRGSSGPLELDVDTLLSQRHCGEVELRVQLLSFCFQHAPPSQNSPQLVLDSSTPLEGIMAALSGDITYTGCGRCSAELDTDANGIYSPCYPCLPHTAVRCYYRPGVLTVSGRGCRQACVQVPPVPLQKILHAPPDRLHRSSAPGSQVKHSQVAAERIQTLLSLPRKTFIVTVRSHFLCDENSVPIEQELTLLDLQSPG
ncbi:shieldin complex subunit 2-like [Parambassis ranga]|uniref:Shieldin complex subunit 2-like n=1 Tax=Parambassis ranga TaxID=210632 RepID=A0A6P7JNU8_9TELE|nr:shieldin complex subunit 2-like [Parambassis ranga]XP_028278599.1 shieldin complex subunit 2-like [Parambassis ranga]XP_028278600.1 shieldin complex subunit 2-like [Parambassis ranga]